MEILLIDQVWNDRFLEQSKDFNLSDDSVKELFNKHGQPSVSKTEGNTAVTLILGPLTKNKNFFYSLFAGGNTSYGEINESINNGENDESITDHKLKIDSPGGEWGGLTETVQALAAAKKPITVEITGMATSAAYILASQGDKIISSNSGNEVGGLGAQVRNYEDREKITRSSNAPNKNPDAFTKEGEKELIKQLDAVEEKAIKMVSDGRSAATGKNVSEKVIKKDFGRGASMLADDALDRNMIDEITPVPPRISNSTPVATSGKGRKLESQDSGIKPKKGKPMNLKELKDEYPQLCADLVEEGKVAGRAELQDQVNGHLGMAKSPGATAYALECLKDGKSLHSQEVIGQYIQLATNGKDLQNREEDNIQDGIQGEGDTELSEKAKEDALIDQAMGLSNKPATKDV